MDTYPAKPTSKAHSARPDCCDDAKCTSGSRNNYFPGKRLTPDSFRVEQNYMVERRHLLNRAIHGWGVVYGYSVKMAPPDQRCPGAEAGQLVIGEGLALDRVGRELVQTAPLALAADEVVILDGAGHPVSGAEKPAGLPSTCWLLSVHYAERKIGPVTLKDPCSCDRTEWDQVCETVRYTLKPVDCSKCCAEQTCELACSCSTGECCKEHADPQNEKLQIEHDRLVEDFERHLREAREKGESQQIIALIESRHRVALESLIKLGWKPPQPPRTHGRGGCSCLCEHLTGLQVGAETSSLCPIDRCTRIDLANGVPLACVKLGLDRCGAPQVTSVYDACGPRRLVKRNDLLFDLIRGCDLTRVSEISWGPWHRRRTPVPWSDFRAALGPQDLTAANSLTLFSVQFTAPVLRETLLPDCFTMTVTAAELGEGWGNVVRVPIVDLSYIERDGDASGYVRGATLVVETGWIKDAVGSVRDVGRRWNIFTHGQVQVEIEVRGDFIVDCNGQTVDANAFGLRRGPSGNGTQGGTFLSTFTVDARPPDAKSNAKAQSVEGATP